jgi:hypothetical protein
MWRADHADTDGLPAAIHVSAKKVQKGQQEVAKVSSGCGSDPLSDEVCHDYI